MSFGSRDLLAGSPENVLYLNVADESASVSIRSGKGSVMFKTLRCASAIEVLSYASFSRLRQPLTRDRSKSSYKACQVMKPPRTRSGTVNTPGRTMTLQPGFPR